MTPVPRIIISHIKMNIIKILQFIYCFELLMGVFLAVMFETETVPTGILATDGSLAYTMELIGVAVCILSIPLALKLLSFRAIKAQVANSKRLYFKWSACRIFILSISLIYNLLIYYLFGCNPTCGYLALMSATAFLFIWPSHDKMAYECEQQA